MQDLGNSALPQLTADLSPILVKVEAFEQVEK